MRFTSLLAIVTLITFSGCAHQQLRRNAVRQTQTLGDIHEEQVLNNLARFCVSQGATPSFATPSSGGATVNHSNQANGGLNWSPFTLTSASAGLNGSRSLSENWTLSPVNDPLRLGLMKCVYRYATCKDPAVGCTDCLEQLEKFFGKDFAVCDVPQCFFETSTSRPSKNSCCLKYGEHCGTYLVVSENNFEQLSRLTMAILEIATISDEALVARMNPAKQVDVTASFIALVGNRPELIQASYKLSEEKFKELQKKGNIPLSTIMSMINGEDAGLMNIEGLPLKDFQISPTDDASSTDVVPFVPKGNQAEVGAIEALIQLNQIQPF